VVQAQRACVRKCVPLGAGRRGQRSTHRTSLPMDNERINGIGSLLTDLADRTEQLRGYL
jgi:hypothetical protein